MKRLTNEEVMSAGPTCGLKGVRSPRMRDREGDAAIAIAASRTGGGLSDAISTDKRGITGDKQRKNMGSRGAQSSS